MDYRHKSNYVSEYQMSDLKKSGIYEIRCLVTNKVYIGSAVNLQQRYSDHKKTLRKNTHRNPRLQNAWNKYGEENFTFLVVEFVLLKENLISREQWWIDFIGFGEARMFNIAPIAGSGLGRKHTQAAKDKVSAANKGRKATEEQRKHLSEVMTGRTRSPEHCEKLSQALKGRPLAEETKLKMKLARVGRKLTPEHRANIAKGLDKPEIKAKMLALRLGKKDSDETRRKKSESAKNIVRTDAQKQRKSQLMKERWANFRLLKEQQHE